MPIVPVDLHVHTNFSSDADFAPGVLAQMAADAGVSVLAVADHNRVEAVAPTMLAGEKIGVRVVPAVEVDCDYSGLPLHILGYFIDPAAPGYAALWDDIRNQELDAGEKRMDAIERLGIVLDREAIRTMAPGGIVTDESVVEVAMSLPGNRDNPLLAPYFPGGARADNPYVNFYWDFCSKDKPAHTRIRFPDFADALDLILGSGGIAVLAHPGMVIAGRADLLPELAGRGVRGLEAYSGYHSAAENEMWRGAGEEAGMLITCGSDFHGRNKPSIRLGGHGAPDAAALWERLQEAAGTRC